MRRRIAMDQLPRHAKGTFHCEQCLPNWIYESTPYDVQAST